MTRQTSLLIIILFITFTSCQKAKEFGLVSYNHSSCDKNSNTLKLVDRIVSKALENGELKLTIGYKESCCLKFEPKATLQHDTLRIIFISKDSIDCACDCCYETDFVLSGISDTSFVTIFQDRLVTLTSEKYKTTTPTYEVVNGDTINVTNKYGVKSGTWKWFDEQKRIKSEAFFNADNDARTELVWSQNYFTNGKVSNKYIPNNGQAIVEEYYENGQLKKKCKTWLVTKGNETTIGDSCKFYNSTGTEIPNLDENK